MDGSNANTSTEHASVRLLRSDFSHAKQLGLYGSGRTQNVFSIASGDLASWDVKNVGCHIAWECTLGCEHKALVVGVHTLRSWFWTPGIY